MTQVIFLGKSIIGSVRIRIVYRSKVSRGSGTGPGDPASRGRSGNAGSRA